MINGLPPNLTKAYESRLRAIASQAEGLESGGHGDAYCAFMRSALTETVGEFGPQSQDLAFTKLVGAVVDNSEAVPEARQGLWRTAFQVLAAGVPGSASVALAKSVEAVEGSLAPDNRGWLTQEALQESRVGYGQTIDAAVDHANLAVRVYADQSIPFPQREVIASNSLHTIASMEDWKVSC